MPELTLSARFRVRRPVAEGSGDSSSGVAAAMSDGVECQSLVAVPLPRHSIAASGGDASAPCVLEVSTVFPSALSRTLVLDSVVEVGFEVTSRGYTGPVLVSAVSAHHGDWRVLSNTSRKQEVQVRDHSLLAERGGAPYRGLYRVNR